MGIKYDGEKWVCADGKHCRMNSNECDLCSIHEGCPAGKWDEDENKWVCEESRRLVEDGMVHNSNK